MIISIDDREKRILANKRRRQRELKQHIAIFTLTIILLISLVFIFGYSKSVASAKPEQILYKHFTSIKINPGDTLYNLSKQYVCEGKNTTNSFIAEVMYINNMEEDDYLIAGNYIIVPYYSPIDKD